MVEDFCRFTLNSSQLTMRAKQLRHELSAAIGRLDAGRLIAGRDTSGDVGIDSTVDNQLKRSSVNDCFTAGCKRLTEALRVLAETIQTFSPSVAGIIEKLRYTAYALEKDIILFSNAAEKFRRVQLYVIITGLSPADVLALTHHCIDGGADCIQLRQKTVKDDELFVLAAEFVKICKSAGVMSIINDRVDMAVAAGADGVHLGQNDLSVEQARKLQLSPLVIGRTTHSVEQLKAACLDNPAYVSLGPVFATPTKPDIETVGLDYVKKGVEMLGDTGIGHVAIGGITPENVGQVLAAGARVIAVCSAAASAADPAAVCRRLKVEITQFNKG